MSSAPAIDPAVYQELADTAGAEFAAELAETFLQEAPPMLAELRQSLSEGNADRFRRTAHSLKANANTFGAGALAEAARTLEMGGLPADAIPIDGLQAELARVADALQALKSKGGDD